MAQVIKTNGGSSNPSARVEKLFSDVSKRFASSSAIPMTTVATIERFPAAEEVAEAISMAIQAQSIRDIPEALSPQRLQNYLNFLMFARIRQIQNRSVRDDRGQFIPKNFKYPAILWPILCAIGNAEDYTTGVTVIVEPGAELLVWDAIDEDGWNALYETRDALLAWGRSVHLELADALPHDTNGNLRILSMFISDRGTITSPYVDDSPVDVMVRSLLEITVVENIFGLPRVEYQAVEYYQHQFIDLVRLSLIS